MANYQATRDRHTVLADRLLAMGQRSDSESHILIVEDREPNVVVLSLILEMCGYSFDIVNDGVEALKMFEEYSYDVVLIDVGLPNTSDYQITWRMRAYESQYTRPITPIIATTTYAIKGDREKCPDSGMTDYLSKPIDSSALDVLLRHYIGNTRH